ncbi:hypothetical protein KC963_02465 [Candidatus Saccharibacteria bacterium]|nr:hypothetical protein [Candidatus Saccharibacteria bacterium]
MSKLESERFVLEATGEISTEDRQLISAFLGRLGLDVSFTPENEYERRHVLLDIAVAKPEVANPFRFADISHPSDFLLIEHFDDFAAQWSAGGPRTVKGLFTRAFTGLLDVPVYGRDASTQYPHQAKNAIANRAIRPRDGLIYKTRADLGIPDYPTDGFTPSESTHWSRKYHLRNYAIQAGSIVEVAQRLESGQEHTTKHDEGIIIIARHLTAQFAE